MHTFLGALHHFAFATGCSLRMHTFLCALPLFISLSSAEGTQRLVAFVCLCVSVCLCPECLLYVHKLRLQ